MLNMHFRPIITKLFFSLFLVLFCLIVVFNFLPAIVESQITRKITQDFQMKNFQININKLGVFNTNVGRIKTGKSLEIGSIDIDYSPLTLIRKKIKKVHISGITLQAALDKNYQIDFDDFNINDFSKNSNTVSDSNTGSDMDLTILSLFPEEFEVKNSKIILTIASQKKLTIPFEISSLVKNDNTTLIANVILMVFGEKIETHAVIDTEKGISNITLESKSLDLTHLSQIINVFTPDLKIPEETTVDIKTDMSLVNKKLDIKGQLSINNPLLSLPRIKYKSSLNIDNLDSFLVEAESVLIDTLKIKPKNQTVFLRDPVFTMSLKKASGIIKGDLLLKAGHVEAISGDTKLHAEMIKFESDFNTNTKKPDGKLKISSRVGIKKISVKTPEHTLVATGINATMPFTLPLKSKTSSLGKFKINQCIFDNNYKIMAKGNIAQVQSGLLINGDVTSPDIKNFKLDFDVKAAQSPSKDIIIESDFKSKPYHFASTNLEKFIPKPLQGMKFNFNLSFAGKVSYSPKGIQSNLKLNVDKGLIKIPDSKLSLTGISTRLEFKDLLTLQSLPAQVLTIDAIKLNEISMEKAVIKYNVESMDSLFLESSIVKWCKGTVSSEAIRLPDKDNNYALTLYCDRLELTDILEQIGAFHAEGNGTMSGRIPVTYADGEITFDNGFLFSTPGKGGKIIIDQADKLTQGIPMDTPQFSQLDLAKEALKNYDYKWAKLNFNTVEDTLLVNMKFDGSPSNKALPFEYKKELGRFVRVDATNPGSHFQGIKLDVNLKLPFNQVMKFGNNLKKAF